MKVALPGKKVRKKAWKQGVSEGQLGDVEERVEGNVVPGGMHVKHFRARGDLKQNIGFQNARNLSL